jgi:hypothetical protein
MPGPQLVHQFKVVLRGMSPMIWRRRLLRSDQSLEMHDGGSGGMPCRDRSGRGWPPPWNACSIPGAALRS